MLCRVLVGVALALAVAPSAFAQNQSATVLYKNRVVTVERTLADPNDLWVVPADLPRVNDFELKPEGACFEDLCVPVRQDRDSEMFIRRAGEGWFNVTALARRLEQPFVVDHDRRVWSFGALPVARNSFVKSAMAPDFELPNREGKPVRLSDFRGKKVLIVTWASW
jgi:hypothetical protein